MENTKVARCQNCYEKRIEHEFQDKTLGKYNRIHNISESGIMTCTVCGNGKKKK